VLKRRREDTFLVPNVKVEYRHLFSLRKRFNLWSKQNKKTNSNNNNKTKHKKKQAKNKQTKNPETNKKYTKRWEFFSNACIVILSQAHS
jgi:hypothetical protein